MKKFIVVILITSIVFCFVSCGNGLKGVYYSGEVDSGTYMKCDIYGDRISIESYFDGQKIEAQSIKGTYEINDNQMTIYHENEKGERVVTVKYFENLKDGSLKIDMFIFFRES